MFKTWNRPAGPLSVWERGIVSVIRAEQTDDSPCSKMTDVQVATFAWGEWSAMGGGNRQKRVVELLTTQPVPFSERFAKAVGVFAEFTPAQLADIVSFASGLLTPATTPTKPVVAVVPAKPGKVS